MRKGGLCEHLEGLLEQLIRRPLGGPEYDLPRRADSAVALHLLDRRVDPSSKEGNVTLLRNRGWT
jgi:hypothetical protein